MAAKTNKGISIVAVILAAAVLAVGLFFGFRRNALRTPYTNSTIAMGTVVSQSVYSSSKKVSREAVSDINRKVNQLDRTDLSWRIDGSDISDLNKHGSAKVHSITADCIAQCLEISKDTGGLFDVTVGKITTLWNIGTEDARIPKVSEIEKALKYVDYSSVKVSGKKVSIGKNQFVDLGAVGKGLACDEASKILTKSKVKGAVVSVGGSVLLYGTNPTSDDGSWNVGIRDPFGSENNYVYVLKTSNACISTSGDYEKVFENDGKKYHHIINPKTGYPAESNVTGVTVISNSGALSDALSTSCFILGYSQKSLDLLKEYNAEAVFILKDKTVYATSGAYPLLTANEDGFTLREAK